MRTLKELFALQDRVSVITGGAGHLGGAFAEALAENGSNVVIVDIDQAACDQRAAEIATRFGVKAVGMACNLSDIEEIPQFVARVDHEFGRLDVLINNAAFTGASGLPGYAVPFGQQSFEAWDAAMRVNLSAVFKLSQAAVPLLERNGCGSIINIASIYGVVGPQLDMYEGTEMGMPAAYAASKGGMVNFTRYLSTVLAPKIRANSVSPGGIARGQAEQFVTRYKSKTPLRRMGSEEDFKGVIAFLASDAAGYITGQNFLVDGGWTAW